MNKYIFVTSSDIRKIHSNLDTPTSPIDDLKSFTFIMVATLISVIAYVFGGIVEISISDRSLSDLWDQFEIWHILSMVVILFIVTSNSLKMGNLSKWIKSVVILIPVPLFMWASDFWALGIGDKNLFSWTAIVAFVSIFYFFTSGHKGVVNFLMETIDSDAAFAIKIVRYCKRNNQIIIYACGDSANYVNTLNLLKNASVKEDCPEMVFDIATISIETIPVDKSEFVFEKKCKVEAILYEIYDKGLMKKFQDLDKTAKNINPKDTLTNDNRIESHYIHMSSHIDDIRIPISTPEYLRNKCFSKYKNDLLSASLIYDFFFNLCSDFNNEISFCTRKEIECFDEKIIKEVSSKEGDSFYYAGMLAGLWDITNSLKNDSENISSQSIKALCLLQEKEFFWPIVAYTFSDNSFLSKLSKSMTVNNLDLSFNEITGIHNILFTLGEYSQAEFLLESAASSYDFSWEFKSMLLKTQQRLIDQNFDVDLADKEYYNLFMREYNYVCGSKVGLFGYLDFINNLTWIGTRIKNNEQLFNKIILPINELLGNAKKMLSLSEINNIPPNEIWHFHNNSANFYERMLEFNPGNQDYLKKAINHYYKSINVHNIDIKWLSGSLINYAMFVSDKNNNNLITDKCIALMDGYSCSNKDITELTKLSYKYKSQIYDLDEIKYPREFLLKIN
jgi:hypothetical protein